MCSIAGHQPRGGPGGDAAERVARILDAMRHRAPDGNDLATRRTTLGHGRLATRDPSPAGRQPLATADGRFLLVFNGEIHNHRALRDELEAAGVVFRSTGETEVLLELLAREGEAALARLNGEFALALLDTAHDRLLLARDPYGVKPLAYVEAAEGFWFASEPPALLAPTGPAPREADDRAVHDFLVEGHLESGDRTFFAAIRMVRPCHRLVVEGGRVVADGPYRPFSHDTSARPTARGSPRATLPTTSRARSWAGSSRREGGLPPAKARPSTRRGSAGRTPTSPSARTRSQSS